MSQGGVTFRGKSGEAFHFQAWPLETKFRAMGAVYFVTRRAYENSTYRRACHEVIYIGHTESLVDRPVSHAQLERFKKLGANCICVLVLADEDRRIAVERDLLAAHTALCSHEAPSAGVFDADA